MANRFWHITCFCVALMLPAAVTHAQSAETPQTPAAALLAIDPQAVAPEEQVRVQDLITQVVLDSMPHDYEDRRKWGQTKQVLDGWKFSRDGLRIKTKRRWKEANHGTWKLYRLWLLNPEEQFHADVRNFQVLSATRVAFDLVVDARLGALARLAEWQMDIQLLNISVDAEARVQLTVRCELGLEIDTGGYPPDLVLDPVAKGVDLALVEFRLHGISDLRGPLVRELGEELHGRLQDEIDEREPKLLERINRQIDKQRDDLRLSLRPR